MNYLVKVGVDFYTKISEGATVGRLAFFAAGFRGRRAELEQFTLYPAML